MKFIIVFAVMFAVALATPLDRNFGNRDHRLGNRDYNLGNRNHNLGSHLGSRDQHLGNRDQHSGNHDEILNLESEIGSKGFKYSFETSNGIHKDEAGELKDLGHGHRSDSHDRDRSHGHGHDEDYDEALVVKGSYAWVDEKTGAKFNIKYIADEYGYQPAPIKLPQH